jgi:ESCRT-II complex subunit VPS22
MSHLYRSGATARVQQRDQDSISRAHREFSTQSIKQQQEHVTEQVRVFQEALGAFADKYRTDINRDPAFRHEFLRMARNLGVDPLASSKGFWADKLGVGSFYYDLSVQIVDVCLSTREKNGGLLPMKELLQRLAKSREARLKLQRRLQGASTTVALEITEEDVRRAISKLSVLSSEYSIVTVGSASTLSSSSSSSSFILSVPADLAAGNDSATVLQVAVTEHGKGAGGRSSSFLTIKGVIQTLCWTHERSLRALETLLKDGLCWLDDNDSSDKIITNSKERRYYILSLWGFN